MPIAESEKTHAAASRRSRPPKQHRPISPLAQDPRWLLVERVAQSPSLGKSPLLAKFLRYICDRQLRGLDSEITEQRIGVHVFGRPETYTPSEDNIVRNYARTLRKRLNDYFNREGSNETVLVTIPLGGYIPVFSENPAFVPPAPAPAATPESQTFDPNLLPPQPIQAPSPPGPSHRKILYPFAALSFALLLVAVGFFAGSILKPRWGQSWSSAEQASSILWSSIFSHDRDTFVVPADGGLVMMQSFTRKKVTLPEYVSGTYRTDAAITQGMLGFIQVSPDDSQLLTHKVSVLAARRYTSVVDLEICTHIAQLPQVIPERLFNRFARDLRIDDLRSANAILIGSADSNPWVTLFEPQLNFQFTPGIEYGGSGSILNTHPKPGEPLHLASITGDPANRTYGVIAYVPNLDATGHILLIEGINMAGTQAAGKFLLNPQQMQPVLQRATKENGVIQPFELLIETSSVGANASRSQVIAARIHAEN